MAGYCTRCGKELSNTAKFCAGCGAKVERVQPAEQPKPQISERPMAQAKPIGQPRKIFCKSCGKKLSEGTAFCTGCGAYVNGTPNPPRQAAQAPGQRTVTQAQPRTAAQAPMRAVPDKPAVAKAPRRKKLLVSVTAIVLVFATVLSLFVWPGFLKSDRVTTINRYDVLVPDGAFDEKTKVKIEVLEKDSIPCDETLEAVDVISLSTESGQTEFGDDVTVRFQLPKDIKPEEYLDYICGYYNGEEWEYILPEGFTFEKGYVEFGTPHFSTFALFKSSKIGIKERNKAIDLYAERMAYEKLEIEYQEKALKPVIIETLDSMGINNTEAQGIIVQNLLKEGDNGYIGSVLVGLQNGDPADVASGLVTAIGKAVLDAKKNDMDLADKVLGTGTSAVVSAIKSFSEKGDYAEAYKDFVWAAMDALPPAKYAKIAIDLNKALINKYNDYSYEEMYSDYLKLAPSGNIDSDNWVTVCMANKGSYTQLLKIRREQYKKLLNLSDEEMNKRFNEITAQINDDLRKEFADRYDFEKNSKPKIDAEKEKITNFLKDVTYTYFDKYNDGYFTEDMDISFRIRYIISVRNYVIKLAGGDESMFGVDEESQARGIKYAVQEYMDNRKDLSKFFKYMQENGYIKKGKPTQGNTGVQSGEGYWKLTETHDNWDPDVKTVYETHYYRDEVSGGGGSYTLVNEIVGSNSCSEGHDSHDCHGEAMTSTFTYTVPKDHYMGGDIVYMDLNASATTNGIVCYYLGAGMSAQISSNKPGKKGFTFGGWDLTDDNGDYGVETAMVGDYADHSTRKPQGSSRSVSGEMPDGNGAKEGDKAYITVELSGSAGFMVVYEYTWTINK